MNGNLVEKIKANLDEQRCSGGNTPMRFQFDEQTYERRAHEVDHD